MWYNSTSIRGYSNKQEIKRMEIPSMTGLLQTGQSPLVLCTSVSVTVLARLAQQSLLNSLLINCLHYPNSLDTNDSKKSPPPPEFGSGGLWPFRTYPSLCFNKNCSSRRSSCPIFLIDLFRRHSCLLLHWHPTAFISKQQHTLLNTSICRCEILMHCSFPMISIKQQCPKPASKS